MSNETGTEPAATVDGSRFVTEKVAEEGGVISGSTGGSPASKHSSTGGGGGGGGGSETPQTTTTAEAAAATTTITTNKGGVPDGNCSPGGAPEKGKERNSSDRIIIAFQDKKWACRNINICTLTPLQSADHL
jgi:hypothetical protein